jgi:mortality factor 4-like protein 1
MPDNLKAPIVDNWKSVTHHSAVLLLPAPRPVRQILQEWHDEDAPKRVESHVDVDHQKKIAT